MPISKNRRKNKKKPLSAVKKEKEALALPPIPDRRALESTMAQLTGRLFAGDWEGADDPVSGAQDLVYEAWETPSKRARVKLARQALEVSGMCADAYVLLAEEAAKSIAEARDYYRQGVAAGEKALGPETFEHDAGRFWRILETRPYMRARAGLADCLWDLGERDDAVAHMWDMLRLNPSDNQGLRYVLTVRLFALDDLGGVEKILNDYPEDIFAEWSYAKALLTFRQTGPSADAAKALKAAAKTNPHVPGLLLDRQPMPKTPPPYYAVGSKDEAVLYVLENRENWSAAKGALKWLAETA